MRNMLRILSAVSALFANWKFQHTVVAQGLFPAYLAGFTIEWWAGDQLKSHGRAHAPRPPVSTYTGESSPVEGPIPAGDVITLGIVSLVMAIVADAFIFTNWMDLSEPPLHPTAWQTAGAVLKIISGALSIMIAALAPIVVGVFTYNDFTAWRDRRKVGYPTSGVVGCFPAALVTAVCYGHFFVAYEFYHAIGALRHA